MSYGTNGPDLFRQLGVYAGRILAGQKAVFGHEGPPPRPPEPPPGRRYWHRVLTAICKAVIRGFDKLPRKQRDKLKYREPGDVIGVLQAGKVFCNGCRACCQNHHRVALGGEDFTRADGFRYDFVVAPVTAEMAAVPLWDMDALVKCGALTSDMAAKFRVDGITALVAQLPHRENGDCVYLGESGCTIHDRAPRICREFDCRLTFLSKTRAERRDWVKRGMLGKQVFMEGKKRLHGLPRVQR